MFYFIYIRVFVFRYGYFFSSFYIICDIVFFVYIIENYISEYLLGSVVKVENFCIRYRSSIEEGVSFFRGCWLGVN